MDRRQFLKQISLLPMMPLLHRIDRSAQLQDDDRANVIVLLFDALSARHVSLYGYYRETTPNLARFASRATVYHKHYAGGNFTSPGTVSLLTGTYPWTHRAFHEAGRMVETFEENNIFALLGSKYNRVAYPHNVFAHLLLSQMRRHIDVYLGPRTFGLFDDMFYGRFLSRDRHVSFRAMEDLIFPNNRTPGGLFLPLADEFRTLISVKAIAKKFKERYPRGIPFLDHFQAYFLVEDVIRGASNVLLEAREPFLAYLHFFPPHGPYFPRAEFIGIFEDRCKPLTKPSHFFSDGLPPGFLNKGATQYDEYIAHVDAEFGRMCDVMRKDGLLDRSYIVITSDHGELFERGVMGHSTPLLYEPLIHIPLLIAKPGQEARQDVHTPTSCVDLLPTLLHLTGPSIPDWCEGRVLPEFGGESESDRTVFSVEAKRNAMNSPLAQGTIASIRGNHKLIHYFGYPGYENKYEFYDLEDDPQELKNIYSSKNSIATEMQNRLQQKLQEVNQPYL